MFGQNRSKENPKKTPCLRDLERESQAVKQVNKQRDLAHRTKPLSEQISELMASLPPSLRDRPWSMAELTARYRVSIEIIRTVSTSCTRIDEAGKMMTRIEQTGE